MLLVAARRLPLLAPIAGADRCRLWSIRRESRQLPRPQTQLSLACLHGPCPAS